MGWFLRCQGSLSLLFVNTASCIHWLLNTHLQRCLSVLSSPGSPNRPLGRVVYTLQLLPPSPAREDMVTFLSSSGGLAGAYRWHRFVCPAAPVPSHFLVHAATQLLTCVSPEPALLLCPWEGLEVPCAWLTDSFISQLSPPIPPSQWWCRTCACEFTDSPLTL